MGDKTKGIPNRLGEGGAHLAAGKSAGDPGIDEILQGLGGRVGGPYADSTALTASLAENRGDGQLAVKLDDYSIWVWKNASVTAADATHIAPTDVGVGAGRWVRAVAGPA